LCAIVLDLIVRKKIVLKRKNREKRKQKNSGHLKQKGNGINLVCWMPNTNLNAGAGI